MNMNRIIAAVSILAAFALGYLVQGYFGSSGSGAEHSDHDMVAAEGEPVRWTCSMHPQIILPSDDQQCPICFMDLIPLEDNQSAGLDPGELALSEAALALADVETHLVHRGAAQHQVKLVGQVAADETRTRTITSRVAGRLDHLYVDATGQQVSPGMKLADIYSPQLFSAQAELQAARKISTGDGTTQMAHPTEQAVTNRLRLWGLDEDQIADIIAGQEIQEHLTVRAPAGGVVIERRANQGDYVQTGSVLYRIADLRQLWVTLDAFEADLAWLGQGQDVEFTTRAYPGRSFHGTILFINPVLDLAKRTAEVRIQVENTDGLLKPGMLVSATIAAELDAKGRRLDLTLAEEYPGDPIRQPLLIPATAPLLTGQRAVVYLKKEKAGQAVFQGRQVVLGPRAGDHFVVTEGLVEGDEVVSRGAFKIDSALQIQAQPSMMSFSPVPPEFAQALQQALAAYFGLQEALGADDDSAAIAALPRLEAVLAEVDVQAKALIGPDRAVWIRHSSEIFRALQALHQPAGIEPRRLAFEPLSDHLWAVAEKFGPAAGMKVYRFNCPMAMEGRGANWMQDDDLLTNPYFGSSMLRCGTKVGVIQ